MVNEIIGYLDFIDVSDFNYSHMNNQDELMFSNVKFESLSNSSELYDICNIAIIGVPESRNSTCKEVSKSPLQIRKELYGLYVPGEINIIDFGNIKHGKTVKDTYIALTEVVFELLKNELEVIIIGGSKDLIVPLCNAYKKGDKLFNLCVVEPSFNLTDNSGFFSEETYLAEIIEKNNKLFNYSNLGYQSYYNSISSINYIKENFEAIRLGFSRASLISNEPYIRDADVFSVDLSSVKASDAPGVTKPTIHGYYGEEVCQLASYAGFSDKVSSFGIYNMCQSKDNKNQTSQLAAQIIWHFIQGYYSRRGEYPNTEISKMKKYLVDVEGLDKKINFYKSEDTGRWWVEVPFKSKKKSGSKIISCSENDYQIAIQNEIPERWWNFYQKFNL